jgi:L-threonylcarbamoyladenylate synthase
LKRFRVDPASPDPAVIAEAAEILREGGTVAFPTETVYGLGGNALDPEAISRIYAAKGRPSFNPLIVHCADVEAARALAADWPAGAETLARRFWPGPLTLVVRKREAVPDAVTAGLPNVALRVPAHPVALALLKAAGVPVAAPSANRYTELSPTSAAHVAKSLDGRINALLDGGPTMVGLESTVVDLSGEEPVLLRPGLISEPELASALGRPLRAPDEYAGDTPRPAPGMTRRHYAPRATLRLIHADAWRQESVAVSAARERGERVAALLLGLPDSESALRGIQRAIRMPLDPAEYGSRLYAMLHQLDEEGFGLVLVEAPPPGPQWNAVRDRLARAATEAPGHEPSPERL